MRNIHSIEVHRKGELVVLQVVANAFLHHMVRNISGSILAVGDGRKSITWLAEILAGRDRTAAADTAPASGLYLADVKYPTQFELPRTPYGPMLLGPDC
jgi:tRNA pseudouridine38-40 synthase